MNRLDLYVCSISFPTEATNYEDAIEDAENFFKEHGIGFYWGEHISLVDENGVEMEHVYKQRQMDFHN